MDGLNIATKAGEGDANIYHWEGAQKAVAQLQQKDMLEQKYYRDEYRRSQIRLDTASAKVRPPDIPEAQAIYAKFRDASIGLMDRRTRSDPQKFAELTQMRDDAMTDYLSHVGRSAELGKYEASLDMMRNRDKGINWDTPEEYNRKRQILRATSVTDAPATGLDNLGGWMNQVDDTPKDWQKKLFDRKIQPETENVYDEKKRLKGTIEKNYSVSTKPIAQLSLESLQFYQSSKTLQNKNVAEYDDLAKNDPDKIAKTIQLAREIAKTEPNSELAPLDMNPEGYFLATNIIAAKTKQYEGSKPLKYDALYMQNDRQASQWAMFEEGQTNKLKIAADKLSAKNQAGQNVEVPDAPTIERALANPTLVVNGRTMLEQVVDVTSTMNSYTTNKSNGMQLQPFAVYGNSKVKNNTFYHNVIKQTMERFGEAFEKNPGEFAALKNTLYNTKLNISVPARMQALANAVNKVNAANGVNARFTGPELQQSMSMIMRKNYLTPIKDYSGNITGYKEEKKIGLLKMETPEFRDFYTQQRTMMVEKLKKVSMGLAANTTIDDGEDNGVEDPNPPAPAAPAAPAAAPAQTTTVTTSTSSKLKFKTNKAGKFIIPNL